MERMKRRSTIDYLIHVCQRAHNQLHLLEAEKQRMEDVKRRMESYEQTATTSEYIENYKGNISALNYSIKLTEILIESITDEMRAWNSERKLADIIDKDRGFYTDFNTNDRNLNNEEVDNMIKKATKEDK